MDWIPLLHFPIEWGALALFVVACLYWERAGFTGLGVGATRFAGGVLLDLLAGRPTERSGLRMVRERPLPYVSTLMSRPGSTREPHHGQFVSCAGEPTARRNCPAPAVPCA